MTYSRRKQSRARLATGRLSQLQVAECGIDPVIPRVSFNVLCFRAAGCQAVLKEVTESDGQVVMFIDEIHTVVGAGATSGSMDASNLLKPMLARGELRCIGATTLNEYKQVRF